ncbi:CRISPR-associated protein Csx15 [Herpetosiphon llansteffanensis]|uniref:CRISPR-associated protein Csx15 n=1 Tax=Herpetosiphon llansteffanensis TaxID=2094568 RepID=UPI000D7C8DE6|nr:CRISPR-associated protein Csx15 [Herpetosiphon llansteffanensis]
MLLINFAHPLTDAQFSQVVTIVDETPQLCFVDTQVSRMRPLAEVAYDLVESVGLKTADWQTVPIIINPPGLAPLALAVIAELHGRSGYFLPIINMRPVPNTTPTVFEVAEICNLDAIRQVARTRRIPKL